MKPDPRKSGSNSLPAGINTRERRKLNRRNFRILLFPCQCLHGKKMPPELNFCRRKSTGRLLLLHVFFIFTFRVWFTVVPYVNLKLYGSDQSIKNLFHWKPCTFLQANFVEKDRNQSLMLIR